MKTFKSDILIVDDSVIFSQGMVALLEEFPDYVSSIKVAHNYQQALSILATKTVSTLILDLNFESEDYNGFDIARKVKAFHPKVKIIILTQEAKIDNYEVLFNDINVDGYLDKQLGIEETLEALTAVANDERYIDKNIRAMLEIGKWLNISKREKDVIGLLSAGLTQKEIAEQLNISSRTVETHIKNLTTKMGAKNTAHLVSIYTKYRSGNRENGI
ncbi:response regulator transcription factor [Hyunsoonleella sp. SJ7]|uniref:Response regulator transcription factor n=1 Tax=Hyunsoonleella aquatilis TaxID=2762758 RepID=A0A923KHN0_9FLAO|nr:response regulator transcription factor [Hyunsoonleella aquatilis]MBC3756969.1 response regulator transcription factor [Hyunsoonleella aquatilis]